jgi:prepilin-type N-terminal cleavage/methylation domain-containing protein
VKRVRAGGFSLIELAVVLVIIGLLVGGGIAALETKRTQGLRDAQRRQLERVREALYGFAMVHGRLPCPDGPDADISEDFSGGACASALVSANAARGRLPGAQLGVVAADAWGAPLYYAVMTDYADAPGTGSKSTAESSFVLDPAAIAGNLDVFDHHDEGDADTRTLAADVPAVVVSFGPQGGQVWRSSGFVCPGDGAPADGFSDNETDNCGDDPNQFVEAGYSTVDSGNRFDDMLIWLPDPILKACMVDAGKLP